VDARHGDPDLQDARKKFVVTVIAYVVTIVLGLFVPVVAIMLYFAIAVYMVVPFRTVVRELFGRGRVTIRFRPTVPSRSQNTGYTRGFDFTSRFGKWSHLGITQSASDDMYPDMQTFTLARAAFSSRYIAIETEEHFSNDKTAKGNYAILQQATPQEAKPIARYSSAKYCHGGAGGYPFVDIGNGALVYGIGFPPRSSPE